MFSLILREIGGVLSFTTLVGVIGGGLVLIITGIASLLEIGIFAGVLFILVMMIEKSLEEPGASYRKYL